MENLMEKAKNVIISMLPKKVEPVTQNDIVEMVDMALNMPLFQGKVDREQLIREIESIIATINTGEKNYETSERSI